MPDRLDLSAYLCPDCRGLGMEYHGWWARLCPACKGTGWSHYWTVYDLARLDMRKFSEAARDEQERTFEPA